MKVKSVFILFILSFFVLTTTDAQIVQLAVFKMEKLEKGEIYKSIPATTYKQYAGINFSELSYEGKDLIPNPNGFFGATPYRSKTADMSKFYGFSIAVDAKNQISIDSIMFQVKTINPNSPVKYDLLFSESADMTNAKVIFKENTVVAQPNTAFNLGVNLTGEKQLLLLGGKTYYFKLYPYAGNGIGGIIVPKVYLGTIKKNSKL